MIKRAHENVVRILAVGDNSWMVMPDWSFVNKSFELPSRNMHLLGIDLGTSSVKALLMKASGQILGRGSAEYHIYHPQPGCAEQRPEDWWQATIAAVHQAIESAEEGPPSMMAIGLSGQMHGTVLLNGSMELLAPAVIWPDQRSKDQVLEITEMIGAEPLVQLTGSPIATGFQAATIRWYQQHRPDLWQKVEMILAPKDYLRWRLTGELHTDPSDGSGTLLFDVRQRAWSNELQKLLNIQENQLPPVVPSDHIAGQLTRRAAKALGLASGIPVVTGAADTACGILGAGVVDDRVLLLTISTGGQLILPAAEVNVDKKGRIHTFCSAYAPDSGQPGWYQMAATLSAGLSLRWLRDQVFNIEGKDAYGLMTSWAEKVPAGAKGLIFLPYLVGERTPHMDPLARGLFLGLTTSHGRAELVRAVMEGVTLACYDAYSILAECGARPGRIVMAGGGARSSLWQRIVADVFDLPVQSLETTEQAAAGAVLLAGSGSGLFDLRTQADQWTKYGPLIEPDHLNQAHYRELFDIFRAAYPKHRADFGRLNAL